jgi:hypothetical protein
MAHDEHTPLALVLTEEESDDELPPVPVGMMHQSCKLQVNGYA